jgi:alkylation response protein AidB-like acyl-CoA dehydrogenase
MFIMMNAARFAVGLEGVAVAERAYQAALAYAKQRVQGTEGASSERVAIIRHPDVRRMLMLMKSQTEAMRALAYVVAGAMDFVHKTGDKKYQAFVDLMIPVVKGWSTETGIEIASIGVQVHGGMGFVEETGAAQYLRDARITTIYEGTTASKRWTSSAARSRATAATRQSSGSWKSGSSMPSSRATRKSAVRLPKESRRSRSASSSSWAPRTRAHLSPARCRS